MDSRRLGGFALLALANLFWSGNWVIGRALRDSFDPLSLNFWRWLLAAIVLAPFALRAVAAKWTLVRRHAGLLAVLSLTSVVLFQMLIYLGLETTTAINAVLINAAGPLFIVLGSWILEREKATLRQVAGLVLSFAGILLIVCRGEPARIVELEVHRGDAWILLAMPIWGVYCVLVKRLPAELRDASLTFLISAIGVAMLLPAFAIHAIMVPPRWPSATDVAGVLYVGLAASVAAYLCWNRGLSIVGANAAGFTMPLLPAFGTLLAMAFLGESFHAFHAAGIATILAGVLLSTRK